MKDATQIVIVLDRSGSMEVVREATIASFNEFMTSQKAHPSEAQVFFAQFNTEYQVLFDKPIADAPSLSYLTYQPNGGTALYDAVGHTIDVMGQRLNAIPESERPNKVVFVILTDGEENSSRRYSQQMIAERIGHQRTKYSWDFVFLGANQDAVLTARGLNIPMPAAMTYRAAPDQVSAAIGAASRYVGARRLGMTAAFSAEDRAEAMIEEHVSAGDEDSQHKGNTGSLFSRVRRRLKPDAHTNHA